jgi:hypothetical protein
VRVYCCIVIVFDWSLCLEAMEDAASACFKDHTKCRPHVVLIPIPPPGHSQPCVQLAKKLAKSGVVVTIVSSDLHIEELKAVRSKNAASLHPRIRLVGLQDGTKLSSTTFFDVVNEEPTVETRLSERLESVLREMLMVSADNNITTDADNEYDDDIVGAPCCVISDFLAIGWAHIPASKLQLECHVIYASPVNIFSFLLQVYIFLSCNLPLELECGSTQPIRIVVVTNSFIQFLIPITGCRMRICRK